MPKTVPIGGWFRSIIVGNRLYLGWLTCLEKSWKNEGKFLHCEGWIQRGPITCNCNIVQAGWIKSVMSVTAAGCHLIRVSLYLLMDKVSPKWSERSSATVSPSLVVVFPVFTAASHCLIIPCRTFNCSQSPDADYSVGIDLVQQRGLILRLSDNQPAVGLAPLFHSCLSNRMFSRGCWMRNDSGERVCCCFSDNSEKI